VIFLGTGEQVKMQILEQLDQMRILVNNKKGKIVNSNAYDDSRKRYS
jgi:hypothetical protein